MAIHSSKQVNALRQWGLSACMLLFNLLLIGQPLVWSDPVEVADGYSNLRPRLTLTGEGNPVVVWGSPGNQPVYVARWNGSTFDEPVAVSPPGIDPYCAVWTGPDIAASGNDAWVVFDAEVGQDFRVYTVKSTDGGATFADTVHVGGNSGITRFTAIGADDGANPVVTFMDHDPGYANPRYVVANSPDHGESWLAPVDASNSLTGNEVCDCCPAEILTEGSNQLLMFRNNDANLRDMWVSASTDGGQTFPAGNDVDEAGWMINACPSTGPDGFIRGDSVIMTWMTGGYGGPGRIMLTTVHKTAATGGTNIMVAPEAEGGQNYPRIHGDEQVFGLVYQETVNGSLECFFAYSTNGTTRFDETSILINTVTSGNQTNPDVIYDNGVFHFTYQDSYSGNVIYRTATLQDVGLYEHPAMDFKLHPNPVQHRLHIRLPDRPGAGEVVIFNSQNSMVYRADIPAGEDEMEVDMNGLASGVYAVMLRSRTGTAVKKLIKTN